MVKPFTKISIKDNDNINSVVNRLQDNVSDSFKPILSNKLLDGTIVQVSLQTNVDQNVAHGLGRPYVGFIPILKNQPNIDIWLSNRENNQKDKIIIINSTGNVQASIYFF